MRAAFVRMAVLAVVLASTVTSCSEPPTQPGPVASLDATPRLLQSGGVAEWLGGYPDPASPAPGAAILVGAGDIAECYQGNPPPVTNPPDASATAAAQTAQLLGRFPETATIMAVGDNAYQFGLLTPDYEYCYDPTWGHYKARTRPAAGNHEYMSGGTGYFAYFGAVSNPPFGYYSYNLASWHVVVLNSTPQVYMCYPPELTETENEDPNTEWWRALWPSPQLDEEPTSRTAGRACAGDVAQQAWLVSDLTAHASYQCTAVYFHHPRFSSGTHGNHYQMQRIWDILYAYGADVVITGHDHDYERFAPQDPKGKYDPAHGIREFVVGTGGADLRSVGPPIENSEVLFTGTHGVLGLALNDAGYGWAFVAVDGSIRDSGSERCHGLPKKRIRIP